MARRGARHSRPLLLFMLSYLVLLLVPLAMGASSYFYTVSMAAEQAARSLDMLLANAEEHMESSLTTIDDFAYILNSDTALHALLQQDAEDLSLTEMAQVARKLPRFSDGQSLVEDYAVYSQKNNIILSPGRSFLKPERYYTYCFAYEAKSYAQWRAFLLDASRYRSLQGASEITKDGQKQRYLLYTVPYYHLYSTSVVGQTVFYIPEAIFAQWLRPMLDLEASFSALLSEAGEALVWVGEPFALSVASMRGASGVLEQDGMTLVWRRSPTRTWLYVTGVSGRVFAEQGREVRRTVMVSMGCLFLIGVGLTVAVACRNRRPLAQALTLLNAQEDARRGGLWRIVSGIAALGQSNEQMRHKLVEQKQLLQNALFARMQYTELTEGPELDDMLAKLDLDIDAERYRGVYLRLLPASGQAENLKTSEYRRAHVQALLAPYRHCLLLMMPADADTFALLYMEADNGALPEAMFWKSTAPCTAATIWTRIFTWETPPPSWREYAIPLNRRAACCSARARRTRFTRLPRPGRTWRCRSTPTRCAMSSAC